MCGATQILQPPVLTKYTTTMGVRMLQFFTKYSTEPTNIKNSYPVHQGHAIFNQLTKPCCKNMTICTGYCWKVANYFKEQWQQHFAPLEDVCSQRQNASQQMLNISGIDVQGMSIADPRYSHLATHFPFWLMRKLIEGNNLVHLPCSHVFLISFHLSVLLQPFLQPIMASKEFISSISYFKTPMDSFLYQCLAFRERFPNLLFISMLSRSNQ